MTLTALLLLVLISVSPAIQFLVDYEEPQEFGEKAKRSTGIRPKELYFCALKAKGVYAQRSACERSFILRKEAHHCASRRLLMMRIDHQLARLQKTVLMTIYHKAKQGARECNQYGSQRSGKITALLADIALLQENHINVTRHQSKQRCIYPRLEQMKDNLTEAITQRKATHMHIQQSLRNLTLTIESNNGTLGSFSGKAGNKTNSYINIPAIPSNLTACHARLDNIVMEELNCSAHTLPNLKERLRSKNEFLRNKAADHQTLKNETKACQLRLLQCQASDVCDELQMTIVKENRTDVELQQVTEQLDTCTDTLTSLKQKIPRCEATLNRAYFTHDDLLINVTTTRIQRQEMENSVIQCETQLSLCHENLTVCQDMSAELEGGVAGCWADLDKWKFRTDLCEGQASMLLQNINATEDFIGDMHAKLRTDRTDLELCRNLQLHHKAGHVEAVDVLTGLTTELNSTREALAVCHDQCPHLKKVPASSRCPPVDHGMHWYQTSSGCFFVTRPGAGFSRMQEFCSEQAPGAAIARLSSQAMARDAYEAFQKRYMVASRAEPLRRQRRAWVDFEDGFEYLGTPAKSPQCKYVTCNCWTMRFLWKGRSQMYECEEVNLPAICHVPLSNQ